MDPSDRFLILIILTFISPFVIGIIGLSIESYRTYNLRMECIKQTEITDFCKVIIKNMENK